MDGFNNEALNLGFIGEFISKISESGLLKDIILVVLGVYFFYTIILFIRKIVDKHS
jgi:hypothetical protein